MNTKDFLPTPHPSKAIFKKHKYPVAAVAKYLGLSYNFTCNILAGIVRVTPENEFKLRELTEALEGEGMK